MKHAVRFLALLGILALAFTPGFSGDDDVTLEGAFVWARDDGNHEGDLKAVLSPTGEGAWDISFYFDWDDGPHIYTGSCAGSLDGELSGDIVSDGDGDMNFKFSGAFTDGTFSGTHGFVDDGEVKDAGTLTLSAKASE
ncbi:MAG: hypothetical protein OEV00_01520 [Acidobacteriota bacterium]|nr:hypothetical protein [Acidobacteriota bacterium]MDH3783986.1 hypothetical protein [Acidobacteriota bacterium]